MKPLREIVGYVTELTGKGKLDAIQKHHGSEFQKAKRGSDARAYHGSQSDRAKRDLTIRDRKNPDSGRTELTKPKERTDQLKIVAGISKRNKVIKARMDAPKPKREKPTPKPLSAAAANIRF